MRPLKEITEEHKELGRQRAILRMQEELEKRGAELVEFEEAEHGPDNFKFWYKGVPVLFSLFKYSSGNYHYGGLYLPTPLIPKGLVSSSNLFEFEQLDQAFEDIQTRPTNYGVSFEQLQKHYEDEYHRVKSQRQNPDFDQMGFYRESFISKFKFWNKDDKPDEDWQLKAEVVGEIIDKKLLEMGAELITHQFNSKDRQKPNLVFEFWLNGIPLKYQINLAHHDGILFIICDNMGTMFTIITREVSGYQLLEGKIKELIRDFQRQAGDKLEAMMQHFQRRYNQDKMKNENPDFDQLGFFELKNWKQFNSGLIQAHES